MEYLVILKEETSPINKKFNQIKRWFVENFNKNINNFTFAHQNEIQLDLIKSHKFFIIAPNTFPMLNSNNLEHFHKSDQNFLVGGKNNCIGYIVLKTLLEKKQDMSKVSNVKYDDLWEILKLIPANNSKLLHNWNEGNTRSNGWFYINDSQIPHFLQFLQQKYFTWSNLNKVKLNIANRYPKVIYYEGKNKLESKKLMESCGIVTPKTYKVFDKLEDVNQEDINNLPECIIKPTNWDGSKMIFKHTAKKKASANEIRDKMRGFDKRNYNKELMPLIHKTHKPKIIAEEYITDLNGGRSAPCEFKFYLFSGKLLFLLAINRKDAYNKFDFYDENFKQFSNTRYSFERTQNNYKWPPIPYFEQLKKDVFDIYNKFNEDMKDSFLGRFIRIDFFVTKDKYWFGEFSLFPNGAYGGNLNPNGKKIWVREWLPEVFSILEGTPQIARQVEEKPRIVKEQPVSKPKPKQVVKKSIKMKKKIKNNKKQTPAPKIVQPTQNERTLTEFIFSQLKGLNT